MKWILPLITLATLSSCTTKPYMVGSVNEQFYTNHRLPGHGYRNTTQQVYEEQQYVEQVDNSGGKIVNDQTTIR